MMISQKVDFLFLYFKIKVYSQIPPTNYKNEVKDDDDRSNWISKQQIIDAIQPLACS